MTNNPLITWLYSCDKIVKNSDRIVTHFMLDGGKLDLTRDYDTFQEIYAKNILEKNCIVELKTDVFKLFIDFDVLSTEKIEMHKYIIDIQEIIKQLYETEALCIVTCADKNKKIKRDSVEYIKQGFHLHWPEIFVNKEIAIKIRAIIVIRFTTMYGKVAGFFENWEKIIDKTVYGHNGIRLIGADKCNISDGIKNYENRVYVIYSVYIGKVHDENVTREYKTNTLKSLKDTSIRCFEPNITRHVTLPEYESEEDTDEEKSGFDIIKKSSPIYMAIQKFFINYATGYRVDDVRKIVKMKEKEIYIIESKSKFCQNIDDFHSNNHIFFKLTPFGFCQRCRSERSGNFGCCRDYSSNLIQVSSTLQSALGWKKPKSKVKMDTKDFSVPSLLERLEGNITNKPKFTGPPKKGKNK